MPFVQGATGANVDTLNFASNTVAGNALIAAVWWLDAGETITSVTGGGTWTLIVSVADHAEQMALYYALNIAGGSTTGPTVAWSVTPSARNISIMEVDNIPISGALDKTANTFGIGQTIDPGSVVPTQKNGEYCVAALATNVASVLHPTDGFVLRVNEPTNLTPQIYDRTVAQQGNVGARFQNDTIGAGYLLALATFFVKTGVPLVTFAARTLSEKRSLRARRTTT